MGWERDTKRNCKRTIVYVARVNKYLKLTINMTKYQKIFHSKNLRIHWFTHLSTLIQHHCKPYMEEYKEKRFGRINSSHM